MIYVHMHDRAHAAPLLASAALLAQKLGKELQEDESGDLDRLASRCESLEASFLMLQCRSHSTRELKPYLKACRNLRIPYLLFFPEFGVLDLARVMIPVGFLIEEIEKAQFASAFGRFFSSELLLLKAKDYGSKAATNISKISAVLDKFGLNCRVLQARKDSFKVDAETLKRGVEEGCGLIIVSASREYGLDDVLFGPRELHLLRRTTLPLMLINPRADLYVLCD